MHEWMSECMRERTDEWIRNIHTQPLTVAWSKAQFKSFWLVISEVFHSSHKVPLTTFFSPKDRLVGGAFPGKIKRTSVCWVMRLCVPCDPWWKYSKWTEPSMRMFVTIQFGSWVACPNHHIMACLHPRVVQITIRWISLCSFKYLESLPSILPGNGWWENLRC